MKKLLPVFAAALMLVIGAGCAKTSSTTTATTPPTATQGRVVFTVTDAAAAVQADAVVMTVTKVEAHRANQDWVTVSSATKDYDLLQLKDSQTAELLADANLEAGTYDQIRLTVSNVKVTNDGDTKTAKLPSGVLKLVGQLTVVAGQTSSAELDFQVDKSLHVTGNGTYIFAPVIAWQTSKNTEVTVKSDDSVEVDGGQTETDETVGTDVDGSTRANFSLPDKLDIDANGHIVIVK